MRVFFCAWTLPNESIVQPCYVVQFFVFHLPMLLCLPVIALSKYIYLRRL
jgi:hypothetical protein